MKSKQEKCKCPVRNSENGYFKVHNELCPQEPKEGFVHVEQFKFRPYQPKEVDRRAGWEERFNRKFKKYKEWGEFDLFKQFIADTVRKENRKWKAKGYVDATPDGNYALRLLQQAREDCDAQWSDYTAGLGIKNPLLKELNKLQKERAEELDRAIMSLSNQGEKTI